MTTFRLVAASLAVLLVAGCARKEPAPEPVRAVRTTVVAASNAGSTLEFAADIRARTESRLSFRVGGKLVRRSANLGDTVKAGQVLAQLDPQDLRLAQSSAGAALSAAQASFVQADADFRRFRELHGQGFIGDAELERHETALKNARAQVAQAGAQASTQRNQAGYASLVADAAGVVTGVDAEPGMVVAAGAPVLRLAHDGPRDAVFSVPEDKLELIAAIAGKPDALKVREWGNGNETTSATVREVAASADPQTRTFLVKADIGRHDARLGRTATVMLEAPKQAGVIKLPLPALTQVQGKSAVWLLDAATMTVRPQFVSVAGADGNQVVIAGGLQPGQTVVTAGVHVLNPGQKVKRYIEPGSSTVAAQ